VQSAYETLLSADGQPSITMQKGDMVRAKTWNHNASFIRFKDAGYFYRNLTMYMDQNPTV
jgi:NAD kinase